MFRFVTPFQGYILVTWKSQAFSLGYCIPRFQGYDFFTRCRLLGLPLICDSTSRQSQLDIRVHTCAGFSDRMGALYRKSELSMQSTMNFASCFRLILKGEGLWL